MLDVEEFFLLKNFNPPYLQLLKNHYFSVAQSFFFIKYKQQTKKIPSIVVLKTTTTNESSKFSHKYDLDGW